MKKMKDLKIGHLYYCPAPTWKSHKMVYLGKVKERIKRDNKIKYEKIKHGFAMLYDTEFKEVYTTNYKKITKDLGIYKNLDNKSERIKLINSINKVYNPKDKNGWNFEITVRYKIMEDHKL
jgi:hypothetical protein